MAGAAAGGHWRGLVAFVSASDEMLPESRWEARLRADRFHSNSSAGTCPDRHPRVPGLLWTAFPGPDSRQPTLLAQGHGESGVGGVYLNTSNKRGCAVVLHHSLDERCVLNILTFIF